MRKSSAVQTLAREMKLSSGAMKSLFGEMRLSSGAVRSLAREMKPSSGAMKSLFGGLKPSSAPMRRYPLRYIINVRFDAQVSVAIFFGRLCQHAGRLGAYARTPIMLILFITAIGSGATQDHLTTGI